MRTIPTLKQVDSTIPWRLDPYRFISRQSQALHSDIFRCRLLLKPALCLTGVDAVHFFYGNERISRQGAAPALVADVLFGRGGVQGLDGKPHLHRRELFLQATSDEAVAMLTGTAAASWQDWANRQQPGEMLDLYEAVQRVLTQAVCAWTFTPLREEDISLRASQLAAMFDGAGAIGPRYLNARRQRQNAETWCEQLIADFRAGSLQVPDDSILAAVANHRDLGGELLPIPVASVELLNILRPVVAVSAYVVQAVHAMKTWPGIDSDRCLQDPGYLRAFCEEVRRFYPFFPLVGGITTQDIVWQDYQIPEGIRVLVDLYGLNHDERYWEQPDTFRPERFLSGLSCPHAFVPQGGGDRTTDHRCPGEPVAIAMMEVAVSFLLRHCSCDFPGADRSIDFRRMPALPRSPANLQITTSF